MENVVKSHFEIFFKESCFTRPVSEELQFKCLNDQDRLYLDGKFYESEIKEAVWSCSGNNSACSDGYTFDFLKKCQETVKENMVSFVKDFHSKERLTKAYTTSFLTLIPKVNNPHSLSKYKPICLVGCLYKILAKLLALRLKRVIGKLISNKQYAFISDRNILDGVLVVNKFLDLEKSEKRSCLELKVDYEKAYDSVSQNHLIFLLNEMGFSAKWIKWMEACVFSSSMPLLVNGSVTNDFNMEKGLRQWDPLSLFLFVIAMGSHRVDEQGSGDMGVQKF